MPAAKQKLKSKSKSSRRTQPYKYSKARDEEVRDGMRDISDIYQVIYVWIQMRPEVTSVADNPEGPQESGEEGGFGRRCSTWSTSSLASTFPTLYQIRFTIVNLIKSSNATFFRAAPPPTSSAGRFSTVFSSRLYA